MRRIVLVLLVFALVVLPLAYTRQGQVAAQSDASLSLPGLEAEVTVIYDGMGIPHIYAQNPHDLFMAQGYVEATHRFWQMDWWRRISGGTLSEIAGQATLGSDLFLRTMNYRAAAEKDWEVMSDEAKGYVEAYAAGVNAYLDGKSPSEVATEYQVFASQGMPLEIAPWEPNDTLRWLKIMSQDLSGNFQDELFRAEIINAVGQLGARFLIPSYSFEDFPAIVEPGGVDYTNDETMYTLPDAMDYSNVSLRLVGDVSLDNPFISPFGDGAGIGSNSWVIGGGMTDSGMPYLANDPHLGIQIPSIWYEVGLHCTEVSDACPFDVVGVSFGGTPGIIIGHNAKVAWGFTNVGSDVQDLYVLTINPDNPNQYQLDGEWVDFELVNETINVNGGDPVELTIRYSVWGPVISEVIGFEQVMSLRWTAFDANRTLDALVALNTAQTWDEFRAAASLFDVPAQNMVYADVEGNIGYQTPGLTPIRAEGHTGMVPVDGSTSANAWQGYIPFDEMPSIYNPEAGYIVTANNSVVGPDYPYYITNDWDYGYRAARIEAMIQRDADGVITLDDMKAMHFDNYDSKADFLVPALQAIDFGDEELNGFAAWLGEWDGQADADSGEALLINMVWLKVLEYAFNDDLGFVPSGGASMYMYLVSQMLASPTHVVYGTVWDNNTTADQETAEMILMQAFVDGVAATKERFGDDSAAWAWGNAHIANFLAAPLGQGVDPAFDGILDSLFNVHIGVGGGGSIVNATGWGGESFNVGGLPSMRQILIPSDWDSSLRINTLGQSGNPHSPHYKDQVNLWATGGYHSDWFTRAAVEADASAVWTLTPAE